MLGRALAMEWVSRVIFLEAAICVAGNLSAYVGRGYPRQCMVYREIVQCKVSRYLLYCSIVIVSLGSHATALQLEKWAVVS